MKENEREWKRVVERGRDWKRVKSVKDNGKEWMRIKFRQWEMSGRERNL